MEGGNQRCMQEVLLSSKTLAGESPKGPFVISPGVQNGIHPKACLEMIDLFGARLQPQAPSS